MRARVRVATILLLLCAERALASASVVLRGEPGSQAFGAHVVVLPNGNIVVADPLFDVDGVSDAGVVSLHRPDGSVISRLSGSQAGDQVGNFGFLVLASGDVVVQSPAWSGHRGAATWMDAERGLDGVVSEANSLVGTALATTAWFAVSLSNGNYVVGSPGWSGTQTRAGAVTWCDGASGCRGVVGVGNSLYGTHAFDQVGIALALPNGNYIVKSDNWNGNEGAITWGDGARGSIGPISAANSLVGGPGQVGLSLFSNITVLANGDYVVAHPTWNGPGAPRAGAVTWASGTGPITGVISAANSLVGTRADDGVGAVVALTNGNYFVLTRYWDSATAPDIGALTWCSGSARCVGSVESNVTLNGSAARDLEMAQVVPLTNGNAVLATPRWDEPGGPTEVGAVTWIDGTCGLTGTIDATTALSGSHAYDQVGLNTRALADGSYAVGSPEWDRDAIADAGAVTWRPGDVASGGRVTSGNSFVGTIAGERAGHQVFPLLVGDYLVSSVGWRAAAMSADVGALTRCAAGGACSGDAGMGSPTAANSLIGSSVNDLQFAVAVPLNEMDIAIAVPSWDYGMLADAGAITVWRGSLAGQVLGVTNSLIGTRPADVLGNNGVEQLADGSWIVQSVAFGEANEGAVTYFGPLASTAGQVDEKNSVIGAAPAGGVHMQPAYDAARRQLVVGDEKADRVVLFRPGEATTTQLGTAASEPVPPGTPVLLSVRVGTRFFAAPTGPVRVYAETGESCDGIALPAGPAATGAFESHYECTLVLNHTGAATLRAEHFGDDTFGYSSSAPLTLQVDGAALLSDGFE